MTGNTAIDVAGLRYRYGDFTAVARLDFSVARGEIFALLGTNGAGKTTTLEIIEGFRRATEGNVRVLGHDPDQDRAALRPNMGIMLQESGLVQELSVEETLRLWSGLCDREDDIDDLMARVELAHRADIAVEKLSGGEKRRLDFAIAIWGRPQLLVLDEPTTGLDPESRQRVWETVDWLRDLGCTILLTTHYLDEAEALADHVVIMHEGRISVAGTLSEVLSARPSKITAEIPVDTPEGLPEFVGSATTTKISSGLFLTIETSDTQRDLSELLRWADRGNMRLNNLNATQASLREIFLSLDGQETR